MIHNHRLPATRDVQDGLAQKDTRSQPVFTLDTLTNIQLAQLKSVTVDISQNVSLATGDNFNVFVCDDECLFHARSTMEASWCSIMC
jgi:hypothetical protein